MAQPILYIAITNHGFGHATRAASVAAEIQRLCPEILLILATTVPRWLLEAYIQGDFIHRPRAFDIGVLQSDSVTMDQVATLKQLQELQTKQQRLIASEVSFIQQNRVGLVLADIPPLAAPIAKAAGIPCWMMSNFGWDFIYRAWGGEFVEIAEWISDCFAQCDRLFRLPLHEPMSAFSNITDVGFTGGTPRFTESELRQQLGLTAAKAQLVLLTFGGLGLAQIPYQNVQRLPDWQFLTFDRTAPDLPNLIKLTDPHLRPVDLMPLCGRLISKPGYSTFAEACRMSTPLITITRADFAEAPILVAGMQQYLPHLVLDPTDFFASDWDFLQQPLNSPTSDLPLDKEGNRAIAEAVINFFQTA